jgi:hypothetical protein
MAHRRTGTLVTAVLLLALFALFWLALRRLGPSAPPPSIRPVTPPVAAAGRPLLLAWEGGGPPFEVVLEAPDGGVLWRSQRLSRALVTVPEAAKSRLAVDTEYRWHVKGVDGKGKSFRSEWFPLTLRRDAG